MFHDVRLCSLNLVEEPCLGIVVIVCWSLGSLGCRCESLLHMQARLGLLQMEEDGTRIVTLVMACSEHVKKDWRYWTIPYLKPLQQLMVVRWQQTQKF